MSWCIPEGIEFSYTSQSTAEIFADFLDAFIEEGASEVEKLESIMGEWEKDAADEASYAEVCRTLHNIKGIAKGVGLQRYGTLIHNFETLLAAMPHPDEADKEQMYFRIVNAWLDAVVRGIDFVTDKREDIASELPASAGQADASPAGQPEEAVEQAAPVVVDEDAAVVAARTEKRSSVQSDLDKKRDKQLADEGAKVLAAQQSVRITSEKLDHLLNLASQAQQLGVRASQNTTRSKRSSAELQGRLTSVRSHIGKIADRALLNVNAKAGSSTAELDALEMDQYSELQEAASILQEGVEDLADLIDVVSRHNANIEALLKQQSSVISSISTSIQGARVVPVSRLMPGLRRIVRTVSTDLGKVVSFKVLNETGALDRDHYARLQVVMEHMVRNALDHGIESPEDRLAAGKPTGGRITVDVRKSGGDYIIRLSDDGKGIDADAIRESAYKKGLDVDVDALSDDEAIRLIFHKGFSTASTLSEISGRGVGMDIVLTELQQIGGDVQIQSVVGLGTTFEVRIPSNVSVHGALLVAAGKESYAIPLNGLIAVDQVSVDDFFTAVEQGSTLRLVDTDCEPAYLATLCQGVSLPDRTMWDGFVPLIIAGTGDRRMAIAIDNVEEALELVVRTIGAQFSTVPGLAGAATTTDGEAIVALDLNLLVSSVGNDGLATVAEDEEEISSLLALVVDDSRTQRMVATSQLHTVGIETVTAENGLVAIDLLNAAHRLPDVVLLDVEMPVKDGIETLREIRKSKRYGHLPVIMVTSRTGSKHRTLAKDAGCNAYMGKPFNFPGLVEQISDLTGHKIELS
jgi:chemosensory pili system protein ChpA (sensor histidine kinase/response regulator)